MRISKEKIEKLLGKKELAIVKKLNDPNKIQDFLDKIPFNFEKKGETYMPPIMMLRENRAHCFEGAIFAALCLKYHGYKNFLMDLKVKDRKKDSDHVVCVFEIKADNKKYYGATSKTNHAVLRFRDPIYKSPRELALSYYHEYFINDGEKTLLSFSKPFNVWSKYGFGWVKEENDMDDLALLLDKSPHIYFVPRNFIKNIRKASKIERRAAKLAEWPS